MWEIDTLVAADDNGNFISLINGKLKIHLATDTKKIFRVVELKKTPPCLSDAIDDLLKLLADEQRNST